MAKRRAGREAEQYLEDAPDRAAPRADPDWYFDGTDAVARLSILYHVYRWTALTGAPPVRTEWEALVDAGWPAPSLVDELFDSWDTLIAEAGVAGGVLAEERARLERAAEAVARRASALERSEKANAELRRQVEAAKEGRDSVRAETASLRGELERARAAAEEAERQAAAARAEAERARAPEPAPVPEAAPGDPLEEERAGHERTRTALAEAHDEIARLRDELDHARRAADALAAELARAPAEAGAAPVGEAEPPRTVLEAVHRAAEEARALRFAPRAFESAADSPFTRPELVLDALRRLDALAQRYSDPNGLGTSLADAAAEEGITQWRPGISELARTRFGEHYRFALDGEERTLGPHVALGSGSGAGFVARIYLWAEAGEMVVGHVGRHLPDTTT